MMVILDMDPGIDDAITLIIALKTLDVKAVSIVSGNVDVKQGSRNALMITRSLKYEIPVYIGAERPLKGEPFYAKEIHCSNGLGNVELEVKGEPIPLDNNVFKGVVIATGPLTNIANAIDKLNTKLHIMGGIYDYKCKGNVTKDAEFNFFVDPEAADIVLRSVNLTACGLDLTSDIRASVDRDMLDKIYNINNEYTRLVYKLLKYPINRFKYFNIHDLFALFSYIQPSIFEKKRIKVRIDNAIRGKCIIENVNGNVDACIYVDSEAFKSLFLELLK